MRTLVTLLLLVAVAVLAVQSRKHAGQLKDLQKMRKLVRECEREVQRVRDDADYTEEEIDALRDEIEELRARLPVDAP